MPDVRISSIIPAWNAEKFIQRCIDSLLHQEGSFEHEIIVVNDGSEDRTLEILRAYGDQIVCIDRPNGGVSAARNAAFDVANGDYLCLLDADDVAPRDRLLNQWRAMESTGAGLVFGYMRQFRDEAPDLFSDPIRAVLPGGVMMRKEVFERVGPFDEAIRFAEFVDWLARARAKGVREEIIDDVVLLRRVHDHNKGTLNKEARGQYAQILKQMLDKKRAAGKSSGESV